MTPLLAPEIALYVDDHANEPGPLLEELREYTQANVRYAQMLVGRAEGALLIKAAQSLASPATAMR